MKCSRSWRLRMFGIDAFHIINLPQCAVVIRSNIDLPLDDFNTAFDHRVVFAPRRTRFLNDLHQAIEQPGAVLVPLKCNLEGK